MNDTLERYYRSALRKSVWLITMLGISVFWILPDFNSVLGIDEKWVNQLIKSVLSIGVIGGVFLFIEKQIRTTFWKYAHPEIDFSGIWTGTTAYHDRVVPSENQTFPAFEPFDSAEHKVKFQQDCLSIQIKPTISEDYKGGWESLTMSLDDKLNLRYAYEVYYGKTGKFPKEAKGYEELKITDTTSDKKPSKLDGSFGHCAWGQFPLYSGTVSFKRDPVDEVPSKSKTRWERIRSYVLHHLSNFLKPAVR